MSARKIEILLIDDSPEDTELAIIAMKNCRLTNTIYTFRRAEEGLEFLIKKVSTEGDISPYLLVLLDLNMPGMSGLEFLQALRSNEHTSNIPVAILTASTQLPDIKESLRMGVHYIAKPIELEDIVAVAATIGLSLSLVRENGK